MNRLELKLPPPAIALLIALAMAALARVTPTLNELGPIRSWLATGLLVTGLLIAIWAVWSFHRAKTTVHPLAPEKSSALVETGVFRFSRNPMYLGMTLILMAWAVWLTAPATLLGPILFVVLITRLQIKPEERILHQLFGEAYASYCRRTRRWL